MFEITFANAKTFKDCIDSLVSLIDEGTFSISNNGITLRAMDPSQIAMVDFSLPISALDKHNIQQDSNISLNLDDLSKILARCRPEESLTLKLDESKSRLNLVFKGKSTRRFNIPLLDIISNSPKTPNIEFDSKIKIIGDSVKEGLKDASLMSAHVVLNTTKDLFTIEATGDKGKVLIEASKSDDVLLECDVSKESRAMFPLGYLNDILKSADSGVAVELGIKSDAPLRISYKVGDADLIYFLAPRIENI